MKKRFTAYRNRDSVLFSLGFTSYKEYLSSLLWAIIKERVLNKRGRICTCCGGVGTTCHHQIYTREALLGTKKGIIHILVICGPCHTRIEIDKYGKKRDMHEMHKALKNLRVYYKYGKIRGKHM